MNNGVACQLEINHLARGHQNGWHQEAYRLECEHGVLDVGYDCIVRKIVHTGGGRTTVTEVQTGPIAEPVHAEYVLARTRGVAGFYGASSMERLPAEIALTETTKRFKAIQFNRN
jgi:predicted TIM-barrel enzyme